MAKANISTKQAVAEVKRLVAELNTLRNEVKRTGTASKASFNKLESSTASLKQKYAAANTTIARLNKTIKTQKGKMDQLSRSTDKAGKSIERTGKKSKKANRGMGSLTRGAGKLFAAFGLIMGVQVFATIIKDSFKLILTFDALRFATEKITDNVWEYSQSMEFLLLLNRRYGAELIVTTERWIKFLAAAKQSNVTLLDTEKIFESVTKASASLGLSTEDLKSVYLALEQMLSKGKVTTEELRRQLGEKLPGAMGIMAASLGVTIPMLDKMLKKGEILSAEVLPDFAEALEIAYGIEAVKKVDTLASGLGRLAGGWQTFVANIGESEGPLIQAFSRVIGMMDGLLQRMILFNADDKQRFRLEMPAFRKDAVKRIDDQAEKVVEALTGIKDADKKIREEMTANRVAVENTTNKDELIALNKHYDELLLELVDHGKAVEAEKRAIAADGFLELKKEKEDTEAAYKSIAESIELYKKAMASGDMDIVSRYGLEQQMPLLREKKLLMSGILKSITAEYDYKRKLLEISGVATVEDEGAAKRKPRNIEDIADLEKQIQIAILEKIMAGNEAALSAEETGWEKRIFLTKDQQKKKNRISELQLEIEIEDIKKAEAAKLKELNRPSTDKEKPIAKGVITDQTLVIEKEAMQKIEIAENKHYEKLISNGNAAYNTLLGITKETNKDKIEVIEDTYNKEIIAAKKAYNASDKIASDKKKLENELKRIAIKSANEQIDLQIAILKVNLAKLQSVDADEEVIASTKRLINTLKAAKQTMFNDDDEDPAEKFKKDLDTMLGYASDYSQAIGGIVDGIYGQRIEAINAEIEAERDKYDKLMLLAEGDEEQRDTLRRDRDIKLAKLEKKRLKEEQKQAKARKAFAIADIVINTAVAISKTLATGGAIFGIPLVPVVAALGALQIAAVLAQPIPKYKDGGKIKKDETAMINDGMYKEYVERNGSILTTNRKNAIVNLKADDIVHKDYKSLNKNSDVVSGMTGGSYISENEFNRLFLGVTSSIVDGFKKAKIINNIKASSNNNSYRDKMSRWNG